MTTEGTSMTRDYFERKMTHLMDRFSAGNEAEDGAFLDACWARAMYLSTDTGIRAFGNVIDDYVGNHRGGRPSPSMIFERTQFVAKKMELDNYTPKPPSEPTWTDQTMRKLRSKFMGKAEVALVRKMKAHNPLTVLGIRLVLYDLLGFDQDDAVRTAVARILKMNGITNPDKLVGPDKAQAIRDVFGKKWVEHCYALKVDPQMHDTSVLAIEEKRWRELMTT